MSQFVPVPLRHDALNGAPPGLPATSSRGAAIGLFYGLQQKFINDRADRQLKQLMDKLWRYSEAQRHREGLLSGLIVLARYERRSLFDGSIRNALGAREVCTAPDFVTAQQRWNWLAAEVGRGGKPC